MASDVGVKLYADGEKEFKTALSNINAQMKNLNSEMKLTIQEFAGVEDGEQSVIAKTNVLMRSMETAEKKVSLLTEQYDREKDKLGELEKAIQEAVDAHGRDSKEATKAVNAYNRQATAVEKLGTQLNDAKSDLIKFERELKDINETSEDVEDSLKDAGNSAGSLGDTLLQAFAGTAIVAGIKEMASAIFGLVEATHEYRTIMGTLEVSSTKAGYTAEQTGEAYTRLYGVLGDQQTSATALANLQALNLSQEELTQLIDGTIGAWATYGDSIPIDGLAEAINETAQVGKVTGTFADVLNWAGQSEDEFNAKLAEAGTTAERTKLIMQMLNEQGLVQAAEGWREVNSSIVEMNEAQAKMDENTARIAEVLAPAVNTVKNLFAELVGILATLLETGSPLIPMFVGLGAAMVAMGIATFVTQAGSMAAALGKVSTAMQAVNAAMHANPILLVVSLITGLVAALVTAYATNEDFRKKVQEVWETVSQTIGTAVGALVEFFTVTIPGAVDDALEFLKQIPEKAPELGKDIIRGLWNGISDMAGWIATKIKGFCSDALGAIKDFFDIESPSKVMRDEVGVMLVRGMANGIDKGKNIALKAIRDLNTEMLTEAERGLDVRSNMSIGMDRATDTSLMKATEAIVNGMNIANGGGMTNTIVIPVNLDGRQIAEVVFNPLKDISKQRGVAFG